jgi:hypothetical protein
MDRAHDRRSWTRSTFIYTDSDTPSPSCLTRARVRTRPSRAAYKRTACSAFGFWLSALARKSRAKALVLGGSEDSNVTSSESFNLLADASTSDESILNVANLESPTEGCHVLMVWRHAVGYYGLHRCYRMPPTLAMPEVCGARCMASISLQRSGHHTPRQWSAP